MKLIYHKSPIMRYYSDSKGRWQGVLYNYAFNIQTYYKDHLMDGERLKYK